MSVLLVAIGLLGARPATAAVGEFVEYPVPTANSGPLSIVAGPDGALWFTEINANKIGRITTDGAITEFPIPTPNSRPDEIDVGPDGNLWFAEISGNRIGRITLEGTITEFVVPTPNSAPTVVAPGSDGNVWFTERGTVANPGNKVGRVVLAAGRAPVVEEFPLPETIPPELVPVLPVGTPPFGRRPLGITAGPDGAMWFTQERMNQIGRIDPITREITEYPLPQLAFRRQPFEITAGPDGKLWFTEAFGNRIGTISTAGDIAEFAVPTAASGPNTIRRGPDPNAAKDCAQQWAAGASSLYATFGDCVSQHARTRTLWFTQTTANQIAKVTTDGIIREYGIPTPNSRPIGIAQGPDGAIWFAENAGNKIGRLTVKAVGRR